MQYFQPFSFLVLVIFAFVNSNAIISRSSTLSPKRHNDNSPIGRFRAGAVATGPMEVNVNTMYTVEETWDILENVGHILTKYDFISLFARAMAAGCFVGIGGILTSSVGFDMASPPWLAGNGFARFFSGAVGFPISIILVVMTGMGAWTVDIALMTRAFFKDPNRTSFNSLVRSFIVSWTGGLCGTVLMAYLATLAQLPCCGPCIAISQHKLDYGFVPTLFRGILGAALINLAAFLANRNKDMTGKVLSIWFPISTYVICDYEHVLASMFFMFCGKMNGWSASCGDIFKFFIPSTLGNFIGGAGFIAILLASVPKRSRAEKQSKQ